MTNRLVAGRHMTEALGGNDGGHGDHGVVAEMQKKTGENGAGPGAGKGEDNADENQKADESPGPAQLCAVHQAKEDSRDDDANGTANANRTKRVDARVFSETGEFAGKKRIEITAKNGFFHEGRDEYSHGHQEHGAVAILEEFLDGDVVGILNARACQSHEDGQATARQEIRSEERRVGKECRSRWSPYH